MDDRTFSKTPSRWPLLLVTAAIIALAGAGAYFGFAEMTTLRQEAAHCGEPGCKRLAADVQTLRSEIEQVREQGLAEEVGKLKEALGAVTAERDRLAQEVASCGDKGCDALRRRLETVESERDQLRERVAELEKTEAEMRDHVAELEKANTALQARGESEISRQTGTKVSLVAVLRVGPFPVGSFKLDDKKLAEVTSALEPFKETPLLVVGVADKTPYKGASAELKQLGLMLARARLVKEMGYEVYYQIRQNDPSVPMSRGIIVYKFSLEASTEEVAGRTYGTDRPVPTFFTSTQAQAG